MPQNPDQKPDTGETNPLQPMEMGQETRTALLRFGGELTLKAPATRRRFEKRLHKNLKDALKSGGIEATIKRDHNRVYVETRSLGDLEGLARCFGIQSISLVEKHSWDSLEDLVRCGESLYADKVKGKRFAVRARRVGERRDIPVRSQDVARALGAALNQHAASVDLDNPEVNVQVEIMPGEAYFFCDSIPGPGGLPLGVEGSAISLVSGGFDSAVSSWMLLKRGVALDYVFCNMGGRDHQLGVLKVMKQIADQWSYGLRPHLHSVDFDLVTRDLREHGETRYWQVVLKRLMLRAAEMIAADRSAEVIVTGDAVGQVSSQTLQNMATISHATQMPILRPLVGFNKDEIIAIARKIGTEPLSKEIDEYCAMVPNKPATQAKLEVIEAEEAKLDPALLERAVRERSIIDLRSLDIDGVESDALRTDSIDVGTIVIDLRSAAAHRGWHYPDALHLEYNTALRAYAHFDKAQRYVLYCEFGLKSAHLAELMNAESFDVAHFGKGLSDLIDYSRGHGVPTPEI